MIVRCSKCGKPCCVTVPNTDTDQVICYQCLNKSLEER